MSSPGQDLRHGQSHRAGTDRADGFAGNRTDRNLWEQQENGWNDVEIDGMHGFIFCNRFGNVPNPQSVNRAIKRIVADYNASEEVNAKKEHREAITLPDFSAHHLRHTFRTRLCEQDSGGIPSIPAKEVVLKAM